MRFMKRMCCSALLLIVFLTMFFAQADVASAKAFNLSVIIFKDITTCVVGDVHTSGNACEISRGDGTPYKSFQDNNNFKALKPSDPRVNDFAQKVCMRTTLNATEISDIKNKVSSFVSKVNSDSSGTLILKPVYLEYVGETELNKWSCGLHPFAWNLAPSIRNFIGNNTDFILVFDDIYDDSQKIRHGLGGCGGTYGADMGMNGAGYSTIPKTTSLWFNCLTTNTMFHEWLHQLDFAMEKISSVPDIYSSYGADIPKSICNNHDPDTYKWFPSADVAPKDPDFPACLNNYGSWGGYCDSIKPRECDAEWNDHLIKAHFKPGTNVIANFCKDGKKDFSETDVDCGGVCPACTTSDTTPPVRSNGDPTGTAPYSSTMLSLSTNEAATCKYGTTAGIVYDSMTSAATASGTSHSWQLSGLTNGAKTYYIKCKDTAGNKNTDDYAISFTVSLPVVATPAFSPVSGTYSSAQTVTISTTTMGTTIHYTLDGTNPTETSPTYTAPIPVSSTKTINAGAWKSGMTASSISSATYTISGDVPIPTSLTLKPGWNQISSSIAEGIDVSTIEQSCTILQYKNQKLWAWDGQAQIWTNPTKVELLKGYWVYVAYACTVPLSGTPATFSTLQLYNGWNKVSAQGSLSAISGTCANHITGNWIWNWDKATDRWVHPTTMQLDKGYWIRVDTDCVLGA